MDIGSEGRGSGHRITNPAKHTRTREKNDGDSRPCGRRETTERVPASKRELARTEVRQDGGGGRTHTSKERKTW